MNVINNIEAKISKLSPNMVAELDRYLDYLLNNRNVNKPRKLKLDWAGGLKEINMTAVELQKKNHWMK